MLKSISITFSILFLLHTIGYANSKYDEDPYDGCTIGVACGRVTSDGRPLLWKTRDGSSVNNEVCYISYHTYHFVSVITAGYTSNSWMGVNEKGFAIINSSSTDLPAGTTGMGNGSLMAYALGNCATVAEFEQLLISTNSSGRTTQANFGVIDTTGAAAIFETGGNQYWKFDAADTIQAPDGYILRTNFAINGGGSGGIERYHRTVSLISDFFSGDSLNHQSILRYQMRDFSDKYSNPFTIPFDGQLSPSYPYGYIYANYSICRSSTISTAVIHGVKDDELAQFSTMWVILGQPAGGIAVPYWPVGPTPAASNGSSTAPLCDSAILIRGQLFDVIQYPDYINTYKLRGENGNGIWKKIFAAEDSILIATYILLEDGRLNPDSDSLLLASESGYAAYALSQLINTYDILTPVLAYSNKTISVYNLSNNYPNPFNSSTSFTFNLPRGENVLIEIFNILGQKVSLIAHDFFSAGSHQIDINAENLSTGVYFYRIQAGEFSDMKKMILLD
jgi:hypothetical protein